LKQGLVLMIEHRDRLLCGLDR